MNNQQISHNNSFLYIDYLRALAIFLVVIFHVSASYFIIYFNKNMSVFWVSDIINSFARICVPIFIMVSGTLLLQKEKSDESIKLFLSKRFNKIFLPFVFWSIFYLIWRYTYSNIYTNVTYVSISESIKDFIQGNTYYHLWFIYMIIGLYLITPILRLIVKNANDSQILYFIFIWFIATPVYKILSVFLHIKVNVDLGFLTGYVGYYLLGFYLHNHQLNKSTKKVFYLLYTVSFLILLYGKYLSYIPAYHKKFIYFNGYTSPNIIFMSITIYIIFKNINYKLNNIKPILNNLIVLVSRMSFGIYFIHVLLLQLIKNAYITFFHDFYVGNPMLSLFSITFIVFIFSFIIIWLLKKVQIIKHFIG